VIAGAALAVALAALGYYAYRQASLVDAPRPPAASSEASAPEAPAPAAAGVIGRDAAAVYTEPAKAADNDARLASPVTPPSVTSVKPVATTRPKAVRAVKTDEREPSRPEACTQAAAALGLCTARPVPRKEAADPVPKREATEARKAGGQEAPRPQTCTEAVAALGLCAPNTVQQRRE
jgi:hypothetical protein